jgi:hypothetical protein
MDINPTITEHNHETLKFIKVGSNIVLWENRHQLQDKLGRNVANVDVGWIIAAVLMKRSDLL